MPWRSNVGLPFGTSTDSAFGSIYGDDQVAGNVEANNDSQPHDGPIFRNLNACEPAEVGMDDADSLQSWSLQESAPGVSGQEPQPQLQHGRVLKRSSESLSSSSNVGIGAGLFFWNDESPTYRAPETAMGDWTHGTNFWEATSAAPDAVVAAACCRAAGEFARGDSRVGASRENCHEDTISFQTFACY